MSICTLAGILTSCSPVGESPDPLRRDLELVFDTRVAKVAEGTIFRVFIPPPPHIESDDQLGSRFFRVDGTYPRFSVVGGGSETNPLTTIALQVRNVRRVDFLGGSWPIQISSSELIYPDTEASVAYILYRGDLNKSKGEGLCGLFFQSTSTLNSWDVPRQTDSFDYRLQASFFEGKPPPEFEGFEDVPFKYIPPKYEKAIEEAFGVTTASEMTWETEMELYNEKRYGPPGRPPDAESTQSGQSGGGD